MNKLSLLITGIAFLAIFSFSNCGSAGDSKEQKSDTTITNLEKKMDTIESGKSTKPGGSELGKEYTAKFICPMHCKGSGADKAGKCSSCGMELIENTDLKK